MIHERKITAQINLDGPLTTVVANLKAKLHEVEHSVTIQNEGFQNLISGSSVQMDEVLRRAPENWYIEANDAVQMGLVEGLI